MYKTKTSIIIHIVKETFKGDITVLFIYFYTKLNIKFLR